MWKRRFCRCAGVVLVAAPLTLGAAEMGRQDLALSGARIPPEKGYNGSFIDLGPGIEAGLNWNSARWKMGESYSDTTFAPQASLFYGVSDSFDIRATVKWFSVKDDTADSEGNEIRGNMDVLRLGVGTEGWLNTGTDFIPYAGASLNYYVLSVSDGSGESGMLGLSAEAGLAYLINERAAIQLGVHGETSIMNGSVDNVPSAGKAGEKGSEDVTLNTVGLGLAVSVVF